MMASDASHMLEAALEQMDDIIAGIIMIYFYTKLFWDLTMFVFFPPAIFLVGFCWFFTF